MSPSETRPSVYIEALRRNFRQLARIGRPLTEAVAALLETEMRTCIEIAREYEAEMAFLETAVLPVARPAAPATIIPFRRRPEFRVVGNPGDGGDAA